MRQLLPEVRDLADKDLPDLYDVPGPHLRAGFVVSVDGAIAVDGRSGPLSSPADKAVFRALRTVADAVIVGAGTAREEDYGPINHQPPAAGWRSDHDRSPGTPLVVVSRSGKIPPNARFLAGPVIVAVPEGVAVPELGADVVRTVDPADLVAALHDRGYTRLLCEGGPLLFTSFLRAGVVDELCLTTAAMVVGEGPHLLGSLVEPQGLRMLSLVHDDPGVLLSRWAVLGSGRDQA
ncbi:MAG: ribD [Frankiales bacterium]|nr:ribD [Frankiales bacterium]